MRTIIIVLLLVLGLNLFSCQVNDAPLIKGENKQWHLVEFQFQGPETSELADPNPFTDYRLDMYFYHEEDTIIVPGFYAADGMAAYTSADTGNIWMVRFNPPRAGRWDYEVHFQKGRGIAAMEYLKGAESAGYMDGLSGHLQVETCSAGDPAFRKKGRLAYVNMHYLQFQGDGSYFLKVGADAPENLLAYEEFDQVPNANNLRKNFSAHAQDYHQEAASYLWGPNRDRGKNLLGAINYLAEKGMNAVSFLTFNVDGDDQNVFPHLLKVTPQVYTDSAALRDIQGKKYRSAWEDSLLYHQRFDISRMEQWEKVFSYAESRGMYLHFKTQETENDHKMDSGKVGPERKLYYRELIARYGHHLALNWNLGEENTQTLDQQKAMTDYFRQNDPYQNHVVIHTYPEEKWYTAVYDSLLGYPFLTGISLQTTDSAFRDVHDLTLRWIGESDRSGQPWVVAVDEPGDHKHAALPDSEDPNRDIIRQNALWGALMAGGAGVEWYFGYAHPHSDLTLQDWRSRDKLWEQSKVAVDLLGKYPFWEMKNNNALTQREDDYVLSLPDGQIHLIYQKKGGEVGIDADDLSTTYQMEVFDPSKGTVLMPMQRFDPDKLRSGDQNQDRLVVLHQKEDNP